MRDGPGGGGVGELLTCADIFVMVEEGEEWLMAGRQSFVATEDDHAPQF
jgi:hypothetical protein